MSSLIVCGLLWQAVVGLPSPAESARRIDSLVRLYRQVAAEEDRRRRPSDTVRAGSLTLLVPPRRRASFERALETLAVEWAGLHGSPAPAVWITVEGERESRTLRLRATRTPNGTVEGAASMDAGPRWAPADPYRSLWQAVSGILFETADPALRAWIPGAIYPRPGLFDDDELTYQWLMARGPASVDCRRGRADRCAAALGLVDPQAKELTPAIRNAVLAEVIQRSGPGAWTRLLGSADRPMGSRLAMLAGQPAPVVVSRWGSALLERRYRAGFEDLGRWVFGAGWALIGLGCAMFAVRHR